MARKKALIGRMGVRRTVVALTWVLAFASASASRGATSVPRILEQNPGLNNLVDPPGYRTAKLGTLGAVAKSGTGTEAMILIPGLGFDGTAAPPGPGESVSFGAQSWTNGALAALERLMADEKIEHAVVVGHWLTGTQLALRLAIVPPVPASPGPATHGR